MREISSVQNPEVKLLVRLQDRRHREREGRFLIEGTREVARALEGGVDVQRVYVSPGLLRPEGHELLVGLRGPEVVELSEVAFAKVSVRDNPDGVLGLAGVRSQSPPEVGADAVVLVLMGLEKPGNLGALLRTADGAGVDLVLLAGRGVDVHNPNVIRASQGSVFTQPVAALPEDEALAWLRERDFRIVACTPEAPGTHWDADLRGRVALALGTEHEGLPDAWRDAADVRVSIPMRGAADSLNVATAGALVLYEALRQRR